MVLQLTVDCSSFSRLDSLKKNLQCGSKMPSVLGPKHYKNVFKKMCAVCQKCGTIAMMCYQYITNISIYLCGGEYVSYLYG